MQLFVGYMKNGKMQLPFCLGGQERCNSGDTLHSITGVTEIAAPESIVALEVKTDDATFGGMAYLIGSALSEELGESALSLLGPLADDGFSNATLKISNVGEALQIDLRGTPAINSGEECGNVLECGMQYVGEQALVEMSGTIQWGRASVGISFGSKPITVTENRAILVDQNELGPRFFTRFDLGGLPGSVTTGALLGLKLCVERCDEESRRWLIFEGEMSTTIGKGALELNGGISMIGTWNNAFGIGAFHLSNVIMRMQLSMAPLVPSGLKLGATACFGTEYDCLATAEADPSKTFTGAIYGGLDPNDPDGNFGVVLVTELTFGRVLAVLAATDVGGGIFNDWAWSLPDIVASTGIYPVNAACTADTMASSNWVDKYDCFASLSYSIIQQTIELGSAPLIIKPGYTIAGRFQILGQNLIVKSAMSASAWDVDAYMDPVDLLDGLLVIRRQSPDEVLATGVKEGPRFVVKCGLVPPSCLVDIAGYIAIAPLGLALQGRVVMAKDGFRASLSASIFSLFTAKVAVAFAPVLTDPQPSFSAEITISELSDIVDSVMGSVRSFIKGASDFIPWVEGLVTKALSYLDDICDMLPLPTPVQKGCKVAATWMIEHLQGLFNVAIDVLNAAKASIAKLASAATFGFDIAGDLFSVQKLRLSGPLVAGLSKNAVGGEINFKFAGQERSKTATLDLDSLAATLFAQLQEAFYELANVQKWAQAAWNNVANVVTITVNEAKSWAENNIPQIG